MTQDGIADGEVRTGLGGPGAYLVVLRHAVVAQDIAQTLAEVDPGADVIVSAALPEAERAIASLGRIRLAFVGEGPQAFGGSALAGELARCGAHVVLMGGEAEADGEAAGFAVLARPFTMATVLSHLPPRRP